MNNINRIDKLSIIDDKWLPGLMKQMSSLVHLKFILSPCGRKTMRWILGCPEMLLPTSGRRKTVTSVGTEKIKGKKCRDDKSEVEAQVKQN